MNETFNKNKLHYKSNVINYTTQQTYYLQCWPGLSMGGLWKLTCWQ